MKKTRARGPRPAPHPAYLPETGLPAGDHGRLVDPISIASRLIDINRRRALYKYSHNIYDRDSVKC